jgi:small GTP-binding protein
MKNSFKIVLIGNSGVGKTSFMNRLIRNEFNMYNESTIGSSYYCLKKNNNGNIIEFQIWDTAGQERYRSLVNMYLRACSAILLVYDMNDNNYEGIDYWLKYLKNYYTNNDKPIIYLIGNKSDLVDDPEKIKEIISSNIKTEINIEKHLATSAKSGLNIREIFEEITNNLISLNISTEDIPVSISIEEKKNTNNYCCGYM